MSSHLSSMATSNACCGQWSSRVGRHSTPRIARRPSDRRAYARSAPAYWRPQTRTRSGWRRRAATWPPCGSRRRYRVSGWRGRVWPSARLPPSRVASRRMCHGRSSAISHRLRSSTPHRPRTARGTSTQLHPARHQEPRRTGHRRGDTIASSSCSTRRHRGFKGT